MKKPPQSTTAAAFAWVLKLSFIFVGGGALDAPLPASATAVIQKICPSRPNFLTGRRRRRPLQLLT